MGRGAVLAMGLIAGLTGSTLGTFIMVYSRALGKRPLFSKPWEHLIFGVGGGYLFGNAVVRGEEYYKNKLDALVMEKMKRNQGVLDEKYRAVLGDKYAKYFPDSS